MRTPSWRRPRSVSTRPSIAGETSSRPPKSSATLRAGPWTTTPPPTRRSARRRPGTRRPWTSSTCSNVARTRCRATSTPTGTWPPRASCPGTTSPGSPSSLTSRREGMVGDGRRTCSVRASSRLPSSALAASSTTRGAPTGSCEPSCRSVTGIPRRLTRNCPRRPCASARAAGQDTSATTFRCATPAKRPLATPRSWATLTGSRTWRRSRPSRLPQTTKSASVRASSCKRPSSGRSATRRRTCSARPQATTRARS